MHDPSLHVKSNTYLDTGCSAASKSSLHFPHPELLIVAVWLVVTLCLLKLSYIKLDALDASLTSNTTENFGGDPNFAVPLAIPKLSHN